MLQISRSVNRTNISSVNVHITSSITQFLTSNGGGGDINIAAIGGTANENNDIASNISNAKNSLNTLTRI